MLAQRFRSLSPWRQGLFWLGWVGGTWASLGVCALVLGYYGFPIWPVSVALGTASVPVVTICLIAFVMFKRIRISQNEIDMLRENYLHTLRKNHQEAQRIRDEIANEMKGDGCE